MERTDYCEILKTKYGTRYFSTIYYPSNLPLSDNDIYIMTENGDTLTDIANQFYKDVELWWVIASVNDIPKYMLRLEPNLQLRIPNLEEYSLAFAKINS